LYRKRLGGGMRQAGVLAAAGLISLEEMPKRLGEDHANARRLASRIAEIPGVRLDPKKVQTNIVIFDITETGLTPPELSTMLRSRGVRMNGATSTLMRAVTHFDVTHEDCDEAVEVLSSVLVESRVAQHAGG
jgi:threonine aldolase